MSSNTGILYFSAIASTLFLFSSVDVIPAGLWNVGMRYIIFARGVFFKVFSRASVSIPSSQRGTPTGFAPLERNALSAPMKVGSSQITASPSLQRTLQASSIPCWPPAVIMVSSPSRSMANFAARRFFTSSRRGPYPSVTLYWSALTGSSVKISSAIFSIASVGKDRGDGFPAAKLMIDGSERDLNISLMADGFMPLILSENTYSIS